jgi:hypothetical protein
MITYLLNYKGANKFTFQNVLETEGETVKKSKKILMGINEVTKEEWDQIKDHPHVPALFADTDKSDAIMEWVDGRGPEDNEHKTPDSGNILSTMPEKQAIKVVKNTLNKELLEKWHKTESRDAVVKVLEAQFEKLKMPEEKK